MKTRLALLPLALVACLLALSACGGGKSAEDEITENIEAAALSGNPKACTRFETQGFVEQTTGEKGAEAISQCEAEAGSDIPKAVKVSNVEINEVHDNDAIAVVAFTGGVFDGNALKVGMHEENDTWKLDEAIEFTKFEPKSLLEGLQSTLEEPDTKLSAAEAECITEGLEPLNKRELEGLLLYEEVEPIEPVAERCAEA